jgi:hypothetical protein
MYFSEACEVDVKSGKVLSKNDFHQLIRHSQTSLYGLYPRRRRSAQFILSVIRDHVPSVRVKPSVKPNELDNTFLDDQHCLSHFHADGRE